MNLDHELSKLKRLDPPEGMYERILDKINKSEQSKVSKPKKWYAYAAAILILVLGLDYYAIQQYQKAELHEDIETMISTNTSWSYE